jgi:hypothetical protein
MRSFSKFLAVAAGVACAASLAFATEQTLLGKSLTVKQKPGDATSRKITGVGKEKGSPDTLVGNPTLAGSAGGAILQVFANGANPTAQTFVLPQGTGSTGKQFWSQSGTGFKYKDPKGDQGPVKSVSIKLTPSGSFSIKAKVAAKHGAVDVVPPNPGNSGCLALKLGQAPGAGDRYSVDFGVTSQIKNSGDKLFKAKKPTVKAQCPTVTPTTTTSTSTSVTPTTTTSSTTGVVPTTTTTTTTVYGSPSRAFLEAPADLLD